MQLKLIHSFSCFAISHPLIFFLMDPGTFNILFPLSTIPLRALDHLFLHMTTKLLSEQLLARNLHFSRDSLTPYKAINGLQMKLLYSCSTLHIVILITHDFSKIPGPSFTLLLLNLTPHPLYSKFSSSSLPKMTFFVIPYSFCLSSYQMCS